MTIFAKTKNVDACLAACVQMSPSARKSVDNQYYLYRTNHDDIDKEDILRELVTNILVDLRVIGVTFNLSAEDLNMTDGTMVGFLDLCSLILPNTLYPTMKRKEDIRSLIEGIVEGSIGDNEPALITYLKELVGFDGTLPYYPELSEVVELLLASASSSEIFMTYLHTLVDDLHTENLLPHVDPTLHDLYIKLLRQWQWTIKTFSDNLFPDVVNDDLIQFNHFAKLWIKDLQDPDLLIWRMYLFLTDPTTLPANIKDLFKIRTYGYTVSCRLFPEYYTTRLIQDITPADMMMLTLGALTQSKTTTELRTALSAIETTLSIQIPHTYLSAATKALTELTTSTL